MNKGSTLFLRISVYLIGLPVVLLCVFVVPHIGNYAAALYPEWTYMKTLILIFIYLTTIPFFISLYQALRLIGYIDRNKAFSALSVVALKSIRNCALVISSLYVLFLPIFYLVAERDDAPGIIIIGLILIFASMVIAVFSAVLQRLLNEAIKIKSENDLTV